MPDQKVYLANAGVPAPGLVPVWASLKRVSDSTDFAPQPVISEVEDGGDGAGWYKFTQPVTTEDLVGVIDGGAALADADRYVSVDITPDDFGMTDLLDALIKGSQTLDPDNNTLTLKRRDGVTTLVIFDVTKPVDINKLIGPYISRQPQ